LLFHSGGKEVFEHLKKKRIIVDWREPNVIRIAPVPLYNSFRDVYDLYFALTNL
jgi:kynureninase